MNNQEISKQLVCISLRNGIEIWLEEEKAENLKKILANSKESKFINIGKETINTADIVGIFTPQTMEEIIRRRSGQWKDKYGKWQDRGARPCPTCGRILPYGKTCGFCS